MLLIHYNSLKALNSVKNNYSYIQNSFQKKSMSGSASQAAATISKVFLKDPKNGAIIAGVGGAAFCAKMGVEYSKDDNKSDIKKLILEKHGDKLSADQIMQFIKEPQGISEIFSDLFKKPTQTLLNSGADKAAEAIDCLSPEDLVSKRLNQLQNEAQESKGFGEPLLRIDTDEVEQVSDIVSNNGDAGSIITKDILGSPLEFNFNSFIEVLGPFIFLEFCFFLIVSFYIYKSYFLPFYSEWVKKEFSSVFTTKFIKFLFITNIFSIFFIIFLTDYSYGLFKLMLKKEEVTMLIIEQILKRMN